MRTLNCIFASPKIVDARTASGFRRILIIARLREGGSMTAVEVLFRYGMPPGESEMGALGQMSDVYGIRRVQFNERERTIRWSTTLPA